MSVKNKDARRQTRIKNKEARVKRIEINNKTKDKNGIIR
jgi:hypothetical protein